MAAIALSSIRFQVTARENDASFSPSGITATRALTPTLSLRERGLAVFRNQSLTAGGVDLQAGTERSKAQHRKPRPTTAGSAPG